MSSAVSKINELSPSQIIHIIEKNDNGSTRRSVKAPLMDGFGMTVGSSFTDPSSTDLADVAGSVGGKALASVSNMARHASRAIGFSTKISQRSNTWYAGPEPTEISFDMTFTSYYSAYHEVVVPVAKLMLMSVGREYKLNDINRTVEEEIQAMEDQVSAGAWETVGEFGFIQSAGVCEVRFGTTFRIPRAYVSSVGVKFSNVLDNLGHPTSAECAVTIKVVRNPTQNEIAAGYFGNPRLYR